MGIMRARDDSCNNAAPQQAVHPPVPLLRLGFGATELVENRPVHLLHSGVDDRQLVVHDGVPPLDYLAQEAPVMTAGVN